MTIKVELARPMDFWVITRAGWVSFIEEFTAALTAQRPADTVVVQVVDGIMDTRVWTDRLAWNDDDIVREVRALEARMRDGW